MYRLNLSPSDLNVQRDLRDIHYTVKLLISRLERDSSAQSQHAATLLAAVPGVHADPLVVAHARNRLRAVFSFRACLPLGAILDVAP